MDRPTAAERAEAFRKDWDRLSPEDKKNALGAARAMMNQFLTMIRWENEKADLNAEWNGCKKEDCPRKFHWIGVEQALQTAIEALNQCLEQADP